MFFFSSTEWIRVRSSANVINWVPTPQFLAASNSRTQNAIGAFQTVAPIGQTLYTGPGDNPAQHRSRSFQQSYRPTSRSLGRSAITFRLMSAPALRQNSYQTVGVSTGTSVTRLRCTDATRLKTSSSSTGQMRSVHFQGSTRARMARNNNFLLNVTRSFSSTLVSQSKLVFNRLNQNQPLTLISRLRRASTSEAPPC